VTKVDTKRRTKSELHQVVEWLTGFDEAALSGQSAAGATFEGCFDAARPIPALSLLTGTIRGARVASIEDPLMQKIRYLDNLVEPAPTSPSRCAIAATSARVLAFSLARMLDTCRSTVR
jgi:hypothetical protein